MLNEKDIQNFKGKLEAEKAKLEEELASIGRKNPDNPDDWEATPGDINQRSADPNKLADNIEEYETHTAILKQLEAQLLDVNDALKKIEEATSTGSGQGKYGVCEVSGEEISKERLEANPAARTNRENM